MPPDTSTHFLQPLGRRPPPALWFALAHHLTASTQSGPDPQHVLGSSDPHAVLAAAMDQLHALAWLTGGLAPVPLVTSVPCPAPALPLPFAVLSRLHTLLVEAAAEP